MAGAKTTIQDLMKELNARLADLNKQKSAADSTVSNANIEIAKQNSNIKNLEKLKKQYQNKLKSATTVSVQDSLKKSIEEVNTKIKKAQEKRDSQKNVQTIYKTESVRVQQEINNASSKIAYYSGELSKQNSVNSPSQTTTDKRLKWDKEHTTVLDSFLDEKTYVATSANAKLDAAKALDISRTNSASTSNAADYAAKSIYHPVNLFSEQETDLIHKRYRYGILNAYMGLNNTREFLFFTKPDLNIILNPGTTGNPSTNTVSISGNTIPGDNYLNGVLNNYPYWKELRARYPGVIECLQSSLHLNNVSDPFNHLLENMVQSTIDVPGLSAELQETPANMYGVNYTYRGSSEASDDGFDFSLEFKDTRYLHVYNFFKAYEEYETLKHHGVIGPWKSYILNKILHDQYSIYKFVVGDDGETLVYYAKYFGVKSKSLPRDVFNSNTFDNGLSYSVDFNAAFVEDMNPLILTDFNQLSHKLWNSQPYDLEVHDQIYDQIDNRPAKTAVIVKQKNGEHNYTIVGSGKAISDSTLEEGYKLSKQPGGYCYKIKWRGGDVV